MLRNISFVVKNSQSVRIDQNNLISFVKKINPKNIIYRKNPFFENLPNDIEKINFIFLFSLINFGFWTFKEKYGTEKILSILKKLYLENRYKNFVKFLTYLKTNFLKLFKDSKDPLIILRLQQISEAEKVLTIKYKKTPFFILKKSNFDALKIINNLARDFVSFNDIAFYRQKKIEFLKKAQIFVSLTHAHCSSFSIDKMEKIMAGADYRIPAYLYYLKILRYSKHLTELIKNKKIIPALSEEEVEIRANTIWAIELIKKKLKKQYKKNFFSYIIDYYLWSKSRRIKKINNHHRTITIFY